MTRPDRGSSRQTCGARLGIATWGLFFNGSTTCTRPWRRGAAPDRCRSTARNSIREWASLAGSCPLEAHLVAKQPQQHLELVWLVGMVLEARALEPLCNDAVAAGVQLHLGLGERETKKRQALGI